MQNYLKTRDEEWEMRNKSSSDPIVEYKGNKKRRCYVYGINKITECKNCGNNALSLKAIPHHGRSNIHYHVRKCEACNLYYLSYGVYKKHSAGWIVINKQDLQLFEKELAGKNNSINDKKDTKIDDNSNKKSKMENSKMQSAGPHTITAHDFVVRRAVFKCMHNNHNLVDVKAVFTTISRLGTVNKITIPAGYCPTCDMYFIMKSTYKQIKHSGIPICRTMDEKSYIKNKTADTYYNGLASESVLMQFGYNVKKTEDLPAGQRRRILAAIVDNEVLSKSAIVSYFDLFIRQRETQRNRDGSLKFRDAIDKWRADREWINTYQEGSDKEVQIARIITGK